jgi:ubiquinol-cytochrome c reductase iron-sulfur subunit
VAEAAHSAHEGETTRRDFIYIAAASVSAVGVAATVWPFIDQMNPAADTRALSTTEVDLAAIPEGQQIKVMWQGKPVFVRHRTGVEIASAQRDDFATLKDPQTDAERLVQENGEAWSACVAYLASQLHALGLRADLRRRLAFGGWFCPCHGSDYDTSGRIRRGPAPKNLLVAPYLFTGPTAIRIG